MEFDGYSASLRDAVRLLPYITYERIILELCS